MKRKYLEVILVILIFLLSLIYIYYFKTLSDDELFNYGFSYNIVKGLIPYRDFNMIILPAFNYLLAFILLLFGKKLILYHIVISIFITIITYLSYKKIGYKSGLIFLLLLIYPYTGYNMFCLFLLIILLYNINKKNEILIAIIISLMVLTKQTLAIMIIPSIIYANNKRRVICIYAISFFILILYLLIFNNFYQFLDYCFLGMLDFTSKNKTGFNFFLLIEVIIIISLIYKFIKTREQELIYILLFQIIVFPIVNYFHFIIGFIPVIYYILVVYNKNRIVNIFIPTTIITFFILMNYGMIFNENNYLYFEHYKKDNFMKNRATIKSHEIIINDINNSIKKYKGYRPYILSNSAYLIKLNLNIPIDKYDLINSGNMGYKGNEKYIKEIDEYCSKNKCLLFISNREMTDKGSIQTDQKILKYVIKNYHEKISSNLFNVYTN